MNIPNGYITSQTKVFRLEDFVCAWVVKDGLGMNAGLVRESAVAAVNPLSFESCRTMKGTDVIGFMNGILTSTASATKFSISRSMARLYLPLTYSGLAA